MFESKMRPINIPQYEHERLAGTLARLWGNARFARPALPFDSFVQGVALHDWHYGVLDNLSIGGVPEPIWLEMVRKGVDYRFRDPISDVVVKLHMKRLLSGRNTPERVEMIGRIEAHITARLPESGYSREQFEWADKITRFCDHVAFDFSMDAPASGSVGVFAGPEAGEETSLSYQVNAGSIRVDPWPFALDAFGGVLQGYEREGYPERLAPVILPFEAQKSGQG